MLGGGVAGVTAAQTLANNSVTDFVIVEYNGDLGGRIAHTTFGNDSDGNPYTIELGANWVQGLENAETGAVNPVWTLAQKYNITNTYSNYSSIESFDETGAVDYLYLLDELDESYTQMQIETGAFITDNIQDYSVRSGLSLAGWKPRKDPRKQAAEWWYFGEYVLPCRGNADGSRLGIQLAARALVCTIQHGQLQHDLLSVVR